MNEFQLGKLIFLGENAFLITLISDEFYKLFKIEEYLKN